MLPLFNLRLFRNNNLTILQPFIDKMKRNELTLENILDEDEIIQDLKNNKNSQFSAFFSSENVRKLIDYATKMPKSDEKSVGYKYPFNATELLCCDNIGIMDKFMNEIKMGGDSSDEEFSLFFLYILYNLCNFLFRIRSCISRNKIIYHIYLCNLFVI